MILSKDTKRPAISELMGSLLMIGITLVAGVAVYGWVATQAGVSEGAYGKQVTNNVNYLSEHFVVVTQAFAAASGGACGGSCGLGSFWLYNNGGVGFTLLTIQIRNVTDTTNNRVLNIIFYSVSPSACPTTQNCGFVSYSNQAGTSIQCSNFLANSGLGYENGFYQLSGVNAIPPLVLGQNQLSTVPSPYYISMPTVTNDAGCGASLYLYDKVTYSFAFTGLFGNSIPVSVTVTG